MIPKTISVSEAASQFAYSAFNLSSEIIPCPIDLNKFRKSVIINEYDDQKLNIVFMGRLVERKGCEYLIRAISLIDKKLHQDFRVLIGGGGSLKQQLISLANELDLTNSVEFLGYIEESNKADFLKTADIAVFPSLGGESFGIMVVEAMASGSGVVIGGNNEGYRAVLNNNPELLFEPTNSKQLAEMLTELMDSKIKRDQLHRYQQNLVKQYDINIVGPKILDKYYSLIIS
jgi:phosphatidylinositol alpha-mannosyltransferase